MQEASIYRCYSTFPDELKEVKLYWFTKHLTLYSKRITDQQVLYYTYPKTLRVIYNQGNKFMENKVSECITGFRKTHDTQHSLIIMLEKWK